MGEEYFLRAEPLQKHIELVNTELGEDEVFELESVDLREVSPEWRRSVRVDGPLMKR